MSEKNPAAWLIGEDGSRRKVTDRALLIGRDPGCDVVLSDARSSGRQALVRVAPGGVELHPLGRNPTLVNDKPVDRLHLLGTGDLIGVPGATFSVFIERAPASDGLWLLQVGNNSHRIPQRALAVGSSPYDDLIVPGLPPGALTFFRAGEGLLLEVTEEGFTIDGKPIEPDEVHPVGPQRTIAWGDVAMRLENGSMGRTPTTHLSELPILRKLMFRYMPTGGELTVDLTTETFEVRLSELRCRLVVALLAPPDPYDAGEFVPDEVVLPQVWPRQPDRSHYDLNTLVHRLRKDLLKAGLDPTQIVERARGGGGTRVRLTDGVVIDVE
ncbi:MAG: FHA domain-containing protein [Deltaproteobacteria bacterium]|nr:FHA domain-containing protein [Deltaproteobacteria bacterium]